MKKNKSQVWVETVIYTLIGMTIIAIILASALPQIDKAKDRRIVEQTIAALEQLDSKISEVTQSPGNIRIVYLKLAKGKIDIDSENDLIMYTLENTKLKLSEPDLEIKEGEMILQTKKSGNNFNIIVFKKYDSLNITFEGEEKTKTVQAGVTPYKIEIENVGDNSIEQKIHVDFNLL